METIGERVRAVRRCAKLTQKSFGSRLNMSENFIWMIEKGERVPSDRTIADICRVCGVDEIWLRTGTGEMFAPKTRREELEEIFHHCEIGTDAKARMIRAMAQLPDEAFPVFLQYLQELAKALSED